MLLENVDAQFTIPFCGIDEAGRGPWAGPVVAAAVCLTPDFSGYHELNDSKKLKKQHRENLSEALMQETHYGIGVVTAQEIDTHNILQASLLAMQRAHSAICVTAPVQLALVDGNRPPILSCGVQTFVQGDCRSASIAAASILAKVTRDRMMVELDTAHPGYAFAAHKGYGTKQHQLALQQLGPCPEHRRSFKPIQKLLENL